MINGLLIDVDGVLVNGLHHPDGICDFSDDWAAYAWARAVTRLMICTNWRVENDPHHEARLL